MKMMKHLNSPNPPFSLAMQKFSFKVTKTFQISNYELKSLRERNRERVGETERKRERDIGISHV